MGNSLVLGNTPLGHQHDNVYFITNGRCHIVRKVVLTKTSREVGRFNNYRSMVKYKLKKAEKNKSRHNLFEKLRKLNRDSKHEDEVHPVQKSSPSKVKLPPIRSSHMAAERVRQSHIKSTIPGVDLEKDHSVERKVVHKYLVVGKLEKGDSFGFGEDLSNVYIVTACTTDLLVIPNHVMMTAERHVDVYRRESKKENFDDLTKSINKRRMSCVGGMDSVAAVATAAANNAAAAANTGSHHYQELRQMIEDKIPSEKDSYDRWRQAEDWNAFKAATLQDVINLKGQ